MLMLTILCVVSAPRSNAAKPFKILKHSYQELTNSYQQFSISICYAYYKINKCMNVKQSICCYKLVLKSSPYITN